LDQRQRVVLAVVPVISLRKKKRFQ
jgi:hypothetical protein